MSLGRLGTVGHGRARSGTVGRSLSCQVNSVNQCPTSLQLYQLFIKV
ncbi:MAG: hypothetical protein HC881_09545 [Leptolyngbyaceae cyanobacterium SL_7_1]|nr:hypothetical protein [Leptolyngbyaceae cyanobacterium SL_7_1]